VRGKIISDHVAILHEEPDPLEFGYVGYGVARYRDQIGEFSPLDAAHAVCQTNISAAFVVMARITSSGCIPAWRKVRRLDTEVCPHRNTNSRLLRQTTCILHIRRLRSGWTATACHLAIFRGLALSNKTTSGMRYGSKKPQRRAVLKSTISRTLAVRLVG